MNRLGTEPYAGWCERTVGAIPPPSQLITNKLITKLVRPILALYGVTKS